MSLSHVSVSGGTGPAALTPSSGSMAYELGWFASHELRLAWRDWSAMMTAGKSVRDRALLIGMLVFVAGLHGLAYALVGGYFAAGAPVDIATVVLISGGLMLSFTIMFSQAMETVTRAFYARDDLDLILSSPASAEALFAVRIAMTLVTTATMSTLTLAPFVHVAVVLDGPHWLGAYVVLLAFSALATAVAVLMVLGLFRIVGAKRARLISQIIAAVIGASFLIGLQVVAIITEGSMSVYTTLLQDWESDVPALSSVAWWPAFAAMGDPVALIGVVLFSGFVFAAVTAFGASQFRIHVVEALDAGHVASESETAPAPAVRRGTLAYRSTHDAILRKEWLLLARDPWLLSQSLMQLLYLIPPALLLWMQYSDAAGIETVIAPVIVMAIGQLAGGLAWLTISGEDAPDLVRTAPVSASQLLWAKIQAVLIIVVVLAAPFALALGTVSPWGGLVTMVGALCSSACAIVIQYWFRTTGRRSNFRRRQTASKSATFCEAFASILCAATAAIAATGLWLAVVTAALVGLVLAIAYGLSSGNQEA